MHEGHFTEKIVEEVLEEIKKYPNQRVKRIDVKVGEVYHLVLESVLMHFEISVADTPLQGVELNLEEEPMQVLCLDCGIQGSVQDHHMPLCEACGSLKVTPVSGNSILIDSIEFMN